MLKILFNFIYISTCYIHADAQEEVRVKIERALACNARFTNISEVQISIIEKSTQYKDSYYVEGSYKSVSSVGIGTKMFSFGDEFHPISGAFEAIIGDDLKVKKIHWKVGPTQGYVKKSCISQRQRKI